MSYMVIFRTPDGKPGYQQADAVQEAVEAVERLRNQDGVENVRIYRMEEVAFEYKVHYTVELKDPAIGTGAPVESGAPESSDTAPPEAPVEALSWDDDLDDDAGTANEGPFDQMAAVDPAGAPRWGGDDGGEDAGTADVTQLGDAAARRGLFGR